MTLLLKNCSFILLLHAIIEANVDEMAQHQITTYPLLLYLTWVSINDFLMVFLIPHQENYLNWHIFYEWLNFYPLFFQSSPPRPNYQHVLSSWECDKHSNSNCNYSLHFLLDLLPNWNRDPAVIKQLQRDQYEQSIVDLMIMIWDYLI